MFTISVNRFRRCVEVKLSGLLSMSEIRALRAGLRGTLDHHRFRPDTFFVLMDCTENMIQPQEVHEALEDFGTDPDIRPARVAIWIGDSPSRMQARRARARCPTRIFELREEAIDWLVDDAAVAPSDPEPANHLCAAQPTDRAA